MRWPAMVCDASRTPKSQGNDPFHRNVWQGLMGQAVCCRGIGPATHCDVVHLLWGVPKPLRCRKIACDAMQCTFQHVGNFAPDIGVSKLFIVQFQSGFQRNDLHLVSF